MINILIADDNIFFAKKLMDYINTYENIKVTNIAIDGKETLDLLNNKEDIDVFLLDLKMPIYNGLEILEKINKEKRQKYKKSCIIISGYPEMIELLTKNEMVLKLLYKSMSLSEITEEIIKEVENKIEGKKIENIKKNITDEILYLGYNFSHIGTKYLIDTIYYILLRENVRYENLKKDIYPYISKIYKTTAHNVKNNIERATNAMYYNCERMRLLEYFNFQEECKPNIKTIIYTILEKSKYQK